MNIGKAIKELRNEKGLNQRELAAECGLTQTSLSQIESGAKRPNPGTLKKLCEYFKLPEPALYILATELTDVPAEKQQLYQSLFPNLRNLMLDLFRADHDSEDIRKE